MNKRRMLRKFLLLTSSALLLVSLTVGATLAYLTDTAAVTNTFTVGKVEITMDETKVDEYGVVVEGADRVTENTYKLIPGQKYVKDPTIHVTSDSEDCYLFVKFENGLGSIEAAKGDRRNPYTPIADRMSMRGWKQLVDESGVAVENVYWHAHDKDGSTFDYAIFDEFKVAGDGVDAAALAGHTGIKLTAYAIQAAGFSDAYSAWVTGSGSWNQGEGETTEP